MRQNVPPALTAALIASALLAVGFLAFRLVAPPAPRTPEAAGLGEPAVPGGLPCEVPETDVVPSTGAPASNPEANPYGPGGLPSPPNSGGM